METSVIEPRFGDPACWRDIVRNNERIHHIEVLLISTHTFLPHALVEVGFFESTSQVKKNRPDLWRDVEDFDHVSLKWAQIEVWKGGEIGFFAVEEANGQEMAR